MQGLRDAIKTGQFKSVYLFYGEEAYLKRSYKKQVKNAIIGEGDSMNYNYFEGKEAADVNAIIQIADTMPFFADKRLVIIENSGLFKGQAPDALCEYIGQLPDTVVLLFVEEEADKRSKLFKAVSSAGSAIEMGRQPDNKLLDWIAKQLINDGRNISRNDLNYFLERTGNDMENISNELKKLMDYTYGEALITREDIEAVCTEQINGRIFEMVDAVSEGKQKRALELYADLKLLKEPPMRILFMVARQFGKLLQVKELADRNIPKAQIAEQLKIQGFVAGKYMNQAGRFTIKALKGALEECAATEAAVKTGFLDDGMGVEILLVKCSSRQSSKQGRGMRQP